MFLTSACDSEFTESISELPAPAAQPGLILPRAPANTASLRLTHGRPVSAVTQPTPASRESALDRRIFRRHPRNRTPRQKIHPLQPNYPRVTRFSRLGPNDGRPLAFRAALLWGSPSTYGPAPITFSSRASTRNHSPPPGSGSGSGCGPNGLEGCRPDHHTRGNLPNTMCARPCLRAS